MNRKLLKSPGFLRTLRRFAKRHPQSTSAIRATFQLLQQDAFDPRLRTHKLKGELTGTWSCSAGYDLRIVFEFVESNGTEAILLLSVETHDEVY